MRLADLSIGRENNLTLLRFLAATSVLFSHSFVLSTGNPFTEPLRTQIGMTTGSIAVDIFFLISGFLVTGSLFRSQSVVDFTIARFLRIFPGLFVMLGLTVFGIGLTLTTLSWQEYLQSGQTYEYTTKCATLFRDVSYNLPGLFEGNPFPQVVNGSLWTLPHEVRMYAILAAVWIVCAAAGRLKMQVFSYTCVGLAVLSGAHLAVVLIRSADPDPFSWLFFMFFTGTSYFILRKHIALSTSVCIVLAGLLLVTGLMTPRPVFVVTYLMSVSYLTFSLAYGPRGSVRKYNRVGDFSYGIYIYAFALQQTIVFLVPGISPLILFLWSGLATLAFAVPSWFWIEKPALASKSRIVARVMTQLGYRKDEGRWLRRARRDS